MIDKFKNKYKALSDNKLSILILVFWAFVSRGFGVIREALTGRLSPIEADILNSAAIINETIVTIFLLGGLGIATLPIASQLANRGLKDEEKEILTEQEKSLITKKNQDKVNIFFSYVALIITILVGVISLVGIIFSREALMLVNSDFFDKVSKAGLEKDYILLNQIFLFAPVIFALKGVFGMFLNHKKSFKIYSLSGVLTNLGSILGLSILYAYFGIIGAAFGLVIGFLVALIAFMYDAFRKGFKFNFHTFEGLGKMLLKSLYLFLPRLLIITSPRWAEILISTFNNDIGGITTTRMSLNIQGVFYGLMVAIGTVLLPDLTNIINTKGQGKTFWNLIDRYIGKTLMVGSIATLVTIIFAPVILYIIKLLAFVGEDSLLADNFYFWQIIYLIVIGSVAIIPQAISEIIHRYFIAIEDNLVPIITSISGNIIAIIITYIFVRVFDYNAAYVVTIAFVVNTFASTGVMYLAMRRDRKKV